MIYCAGSAVHRSNPGITRWIMQIIRVPPDNVI